MQRELRKIAKDLKLRGWLFDIEQKDRFYLSKFDPVDNDDEYRIYFFTTDEGYKIVRKIVIKKYKYKENIDYEHKYCKEAQQILNTYYGIKKSANIAS